MFGVEERDAALRGLLEEARERLGRARAAAAQELRGVLKRRAEEGRDEEKAVQRAPR